MTVLKCQDFEISKSSQFMKNCLNNRYFAKFNWVGLNRMNPCTQNSESLNKIIFSLTPFRVYYRAVVIYYITFIGQNIEIPRERYDRNK